jgi:hypothetical protein
MFLGVEGRPSCGDVNRALGTFSRLQVVARDLGEVDREVIGLRDVR